MNRHPPEKDKSDRNIDDTYVYDSASGLYKPQSHENEEERREKRRGRNSRLPFFANVRRDWLTIFFSAVTLVVVGAYTYYAKGQWHEMIRAANAAKSAAETARLQLELSERPWVHAQISLSGPFTFTINGANIPLEIIRLNTGNSPALTSAI
jgi:hypothetical protein